MTATPNDSEAAVEILWSSDEAGSKNTAHRVAQVTLEERCNVIAIDVTSESRTARSTYRIRVTKAEAPPSSGGPLLQPQSFQPSATSSASQAEVDGSSAVLREGQSRLIFAEPLSYGGVRFVFLVPTREFKIEKIASLMSGEWKALAEDEFQATRESRGHDQDRLTAILPSAEEKQQFLRLTLAPQSEQTFGQDFLPGEAILFPFAFFGGWRQNRDGLKNENRIMKNSPFLLLAPLAVVLILTGGTPTAFRQGQLDLSLPHHRNGITAWRPFTIPGINEGQNEDNNQPGKHYLYWWSVTYEEYKEEKKKSGQENVEVLIV